MNFRSFDDFFQGKSAEYLLQIINLALSEDGADLTSRAVFPPENQARAVLTAKEDSIVAGMPLIPIILKEAQAYEPGHWAWEPEAQEGGLVKNGGTIARINGTTRLLFKAERIILNFLSHMSGIANLTASYVKALKGTHTKLLDTRKTLPGMRYVEKYAVLVGGGLNHRMNLEDRLMLKDNHNDAAGSITKAVGMLRNKYQPCPPIEVECRNQAEVAEAVNCKVNRIMLDNMTQDAINEAMQIIPRSIETEVSGGVSLENIRKLVKITSRGPDFISVGKLTHSAPVADFSLRIETE